MEEEDSKTQLGSEPRPSRGGFGATGEVDLGTGRGGGEGRRRLAWTRSSLSSEWTDSRTVNRDSERVYVGDSEFSLGLPESSQGARNCSKHFTCITSKNLTTALRR